MEGNKRRCSEIFNIAHKLQSREIGNKLALRNAHHNIKFRNLQLQEEFDICDRYRDEIEQIVTAHDIIFALAESGLCAAFDRHTNKRLCYLNSSQQGLIQQEPIRSMFYNKINNSLITILVNALDGFSMKFITTPLEYISNAQPRAGFPLFESEKLTWPGIVEFDDISGKLITFSAHDHTYKVFDLEDYTFLYSISDKEIENIKTTVGIILLISKRSACGNILPLKVLSVEDGTVLKSINHTLLPNKRIAFVELFHEKIFIKQENECMQMIDIQNEKMIEVSKNEFLGNPGAFIFLYEKRLFLTFQSRTVFVWNLKGELVASYRDHFPRYLGCILHFTHDEELIISYENNSDKRNRLIRISDYLTGNCCAMIGGNMGVSCGNATLIQNTVEDALEDVTALFYDKERNEIITGNSRGFLHVWSS